MGNNSSLTTSSERCQYTDVYSPLLPVVMCEHDSDRKSNEKEM